VMGLGVVRPLVVLDAAAPLICSWLFSRDGWAQVRESIIWT
jgi:hypothetical protein